MKKSILNLGKVLNKTEQEKVNGGKAPVNCTGWDPVERYCYSW